MAKESPFTPGAAAAPSRAVEAAMRPSPRHQLRPVEEYQEYEEENRLHIPRHLFPDDFDLQWVTDSVWGKPEAQHRARFERAGWVSVHTDEWGGRYGRMFCAEGAEGEIKMDGLVLMARPKAWSERARANDRKRAGERVYIKEMQLRAGALDGVANADHPEAVRRNIVHRSVEPVSVPMK